MTRASLARLLLLCALCAASIAGAQQEAQQEPKALSAVVGGLSDGGYTVTIVMQTLEGWPTIRRQDEDLSRISIELDPALPGNQLRLRLERFSQTGGRGLLQQSWQRHERYLYTYVRSGRNVNVLDQAGGCVIEALREKPPIGAWRDLPRAACPATPARLELQ